jgi:hypothetical protein
MCAKARFLLMLIVANSLLTAGCAPTFESHIDAPASVPTLDAHPSATQCTPTEIAPLDPRPLLPDADQAECPRGSGLAACFTADEDAIRQQRFKILHDDREYCRDAYDRAVKRAGGD